jgi:hypothetical protein
LTKALDQSSRLYGRVGATVTNNDSDTNHHLVIGHETRPMTGDLVGASLL